ncbi:hypothetical protein CO172_03245 [Candidatus Uhrbacteria bacterium CG_4_9_14_3_um_filter_36_7]|uniref:Uncharacterized protein n=1 Tax=Candidatus Uhrbacteria bacterium CG_4_9_14_3_um_filter_36_7 TaxID=1975033 RepID=A0A2M7XGK3_9BACT|nr:MAG: hypothetical protein CO172_03245 [Candidatus Uhrbacteria bacterium CG_4_9_14_3_um_filter_36_7]
MDLVAFYSILSVFFKKTQDGYMDSKDALYRVDCVANGQKDNELPNRNIVQWEQIFRFIQLSRKVRWTESEICYLLYAATSAAACGCVLNLPTPNFRCGQ